MNKILSTLMLGFMFYQMSPAQITPGKIGGKVSDNRSREGLPGANVIIQGTGLGTATDLDGTFLILNVPAGSYNVEIHYLGYQTVKKANVIVNPNRTTVLEIYLEENYLESEAVVVTGTFFDKPREALVSTRSMNYEEIRRSPGDLVDIQRAVQALPAVVTANDKLNEIIVRGGYPGENLFLLDNIEIPNPNHFPIQGTGGGPINMLNSYMVNNIDFYAGAFSARYGDRASSVMNISLRDGRSERLMTEVSMGMAGLGLLLEGPVSSAGSFMFSARHSYLDWIISSTGLTAIPRYYNLQGKMTLNLNARNSLLVNAVYGSDKISLEDEEQSGFARGAENVDTDNNQSIAGLTLKTLWSRNLYSLITLSAIQSNSRAEVYENPGRQVFFTSDATENEFTLKGDFSLQLSPALSLDAGGLARGTRFDYDVWNEADTLFLYDPASPRPDSAIGIFRAYPEYRVAQDVRSLKAGGYFQFTLDFWRHWRITAGLRYDHFDYNQYSSWSPRAGLSYAFNSRLSLNFAYGRHYQSPAYVDFAANELNRDLNSKFNDQLVVGVDYLLRDDLKIVLESFYKNYTDIAVRKVFTTTDPFDYDDGRMVNAGSGQAHGFEFFLQKKLTRRFSTIISYAFSRTESIDPRYNTNYPSDYDYRQVANFVGGYKYPFRYQSWYQNMRERTWFKILLWLPVLPADEMEVSLKFRYMGGRPYTPPQYQPELREWVVDEQQPLNTSRYPAYHRLDLRLDRRFIFNRWNMVIFFDVVNLYNRDNIWDYLYNNDGSIENVLHYKTLPVGGISLEF